MGKLHKIRKAFNALSDEQKRGEHYYARAMVVNGEVHWIPGQHSGGAHKNFINTLRREYLSAVAHSD